jgi:hypothetical protein
MTGRSTHLTPRDSIAVVESITLVIAVIPR